jgi:hypothetical protein
VAEPGEEEEVEEVEEVEFTPGTPKALKKSNGMPVFPVLGGSKGEKVDIELDEGSTLISSSKKLKKDGAVVPPKLPNPKFWFPMKE